MKSQKLLLIFMFFAPCFAMEKGEPKKESKKRKQSAPEVYAQIRRFSPSIARLKSTSPKEESSSSSSLPLSELEKKLSPGRRSLQRSKSPRENGEHSQAQEQLEKKSKENEIALLTSRIETMGDNIVALLNSIVDEKEKEKIIKNLLAKIEVLHSSLKEMQKVEQASIDDFN